MAVQTMTRLIFFDNYLPKKEKFAGRYHDEWQIGADRASNDINGTIRRLEEKGYKVLSVSLAGSSQIYGTMAVITYDDTTTDQDRKDAIDHIGNTVISFLNSKGMTGWSIADAFQLAEDIVTHLPVVTEPPS